MQPTERHSLAPDVSFDGGDLDCGGGLLLLIRRHIDPLPAGGLLEIQSTETSVEEELPAWCRLTGNDLVSWTRSGKRRSFLVCKGRLAARIPQGTIAPRATSAARSAASEKPSTVVSSTVVSSTVVPGPRPAPTGPPRLPPPIPRLAAMGIGSWPRPRWMVRAVHESIERRMSEDEFRATADDAVRLAIDAQVRAGADVITDGEQRRDSYASFVGSRLENCQLIPLTDLLPLVDDPEKFEEELRALDVPAADVRHPALLGRLERRRPIALEELEFARTVTDRPIKVALPGPYLLTRTMWLDCLPEKVYATREELAADITRILRDELRELLHAGAALVQFDEPVLTEVVFGGASRRRSFMFGALGERKDPDTELEFARELLNEVVEAFPCERLAVHMCRGNWTPDETAALSGDYRPLLPYLSRIEVGNLFLELCTPRAGELEVLARLPADKRVGVGVVNQKLSHVEGLDEIRTKARRAIDLFGIERVLLTPDCGFATFADNPVASQEIASGKLAAISAVARELRGG